MIGFFLTRLFSALLVVFGVTLIVFLLLHLVPGDPVEVMLGEMAQPADREALRHALGLDLPLWQQVLNSFGQLLRFDFGQSLFTKQPIVEMLAERVPATVQLAVAGLAVALVLAFPLGILAALNRGSRWDYGAMTFSLLGVSIPNFWMGPLLILFFSVMLGWFPVSGREGFASLVLPALTLGTALAAILSRMIRATLIEVLGEDYIRTARAKGLTEARMVRRHALKNALMPVVTIVGLQIGGLLGGAIITEQIFVLPGIGRLLVDSIFQRDFPLIQGVVLFVSCAFLFSNLAVDLAYAYLDPRIRYS